MSTAVQPASMQFSPTESQLRVAYSVCRSITRSAARNFYYAFLVLPRRKREALCAVYAFMRRCDDIADDANVSALVRRGRLNDWLEAFHRAEAGHPTDDPVLLALTDAQRRYRIHGDLLDQVAEGTAMDVSEQQLLQPGDPRIPELHYQSFEDLRLYCYRVASVVGLVCIRIFGYRDRAAEPLAERLGLAFQLTNIIRDVKEDAAMGRVYLPGEDLAAFGLSATDLMATEKANRVAALLKMEADRAREFYKSGDELIPLIEEDSQPGLWVLATIYRRLLEKIAAKNYDVFSNRVQLTTFEKLSVLGRGWMRRLT
jgi:phytoene synthase